MVRDRRWMRRMKREWGEEARGDGKEGWVEREKWDGEGVCERMLGWEG